MSEMTLRSELTPPALPATPHAADSLSHWAEGVRSAAEIVKGLWGSPFIPAQYLIRNGAEIDAHASLAACTAAIVTGAAVGLDPLASLRSIDVIQGTPAFRAVALRGIAQAAGHSVWVQESTSTRAIVCGQRKGSQHVEKVTWDMDRARAMGLAGKAQWKSQPQTMLVARGTAEVVRRIAADAILGLPYAAEEIGDGDPGDITAPVPLTPVRRTAQRRNAAPVTTAPVEPDFEPEPDPEPPATNVPDSLVTGDEPRTEAQSRALFAMLGEHGVKDRDDVFQVIGLIIDRPVESTKELTKAEVSRLLDELPARLTAGDSTAETAFGEAHA